MEVTASRAWKAAEWDYCALQADLQMASLWGAPSQEQMINRLRNTARRCPQFYPAILELGLRLLGQNLTFAGFAPSLPQAKPFRQMMQVAAMQTEFAGGGGPVLRVAFQG